MEIGAITMTSVAHPKLDHGGPGAGRDTATVCRRGAVASATTDDTGGGSAQNPGGLSKE
jgi:hypothetical protein